MESKERVKGRMSNINVAKRTLSLVKLSDYETHHETDERYLTCGSKRAIPVDKINGTRDLKLRVSYKVILRDLTCAERRLKRARWENREAGEPCEGD